MNRPSGIQVAQNAAAKALAGAITYKQQDCQTFVEHCVMDCGGQMGYAGSNDMYRNTSALRDALHIMTKNNMAKFMSDRKSCPATGHGFGIVKDVPSGAILRRVRSNNNATSTARQSL